MSGRSSLSRSSTLDAIRAVQEAYVTTALAGDWDKWGETLAPDVVLMPPNQAPLEGREAAVAWGRQFPKLTSFIAPPTEIGGRGDVAHSIGQYAYEATTPEGSPVSQQGTFLNILRKDADGTWRYWRGLWNSADGPAPDRTRDESAIREAISAAEATLNARDFAGYAQGFAEDADVLVYAGSRVSGRVAIQDDVAKAGKAQPASCRIALKVDATRFLSANLALVDVPATFTGCKGWSTNDGSSVLQRVGDRWQTAGLRIAPRST
jgi:uncharacterized protein (TIGR02246 family)